MVMGRGTERRKRVVWGKMGSSDFSLLTLQTDNLDFLLPLQLRVFLVMGLEHLPML